MIFNLFKTKKEKQEDKQKVLEKKLDAFIHNNRQWFNSYAFDGKDIVIYLEPRIKDNEIVLDFKKEYTSEGYVSYAPVWALEYIYGNDFMEKHRIHFLRIKEQAKKLGLQIHKIT